MIKKRILVTGANGYIGTHVVAEILRRGHEAIACDLKFDNVPAAASRLEMNIFDPETDFPRKLENVDCVIHLAWRNGFQHNAMSHIEDLPLHTQFLRCLLDAGVGTVCVMGSMHEVGYWEGAICADTPTNPLSLYGIAKNSLRQIGQLMFQGTDAHFRWLRGYYIYGDDERNHSVLAKILQADRKGQDWFPFTSGKNLYDYLPVDELARQIVAAAVQEKHDGIINCCSGVPVSLGEMAEKFIEKHQLQIRLRYGAFPDRPYDSPGVWGDAALIRQILDEEKE